MSQGESRPVQARSRQTRAKIVDALAALLDKRPMEEITMPMIAEQAGIAVGTLYGRFESRDALIPVTFEIYEARLLAFMSGDGRIEIEKADGLYSALKRAVRSAWAFLTANRNLTRAVYAYGRQYPHLVGDEWTGYLETGVENMQRLLDLFADDIRVDDADRAARMMTYLINAIPIDLGLYGRDGVGAAIKVSPDGFIEDVTRTLYGYLTARPER
ncbi:TetR/AcrR family transcriptional regulator [Hyphobacterium sp.]|uniref:TetR/AcrR family transcriptional regulator n=1 Tax=Hyphobacterium sp. TaxID=2004662 RepID=UPI003B52871F